MLSLPCNIGKHTDMLELWLYQVLMICMSKERCEQLAGSKLVTAWVRMAKITLTKALGNVKGFMGLPFHVCVTLKDWKWSLEMNNGFPMWDYSRNLCSDFIVSVYWAWSSMPCTSYSIFTPTMWGGMIASFLFSKEAEVEAAQRSYL